MCLFIPQTVLALRGSYGVALREGPWTRLWCGDTAGQNCISFSQYTINVTLKNLYVFEEIHGIIAIKLVCFIAIIASETPRALLESPELRECGCFG